MQAELKAAISKLMSDYYIAAASARESTRKPTAQAAVHKRLVALLRENPEANQEIISLSQLPLTPTRDGDKITDAEIEERKWARDVFFIQMSGFIISQIQKRAKSYTEHPDMVEEMIQECNLAILGALPKYDPSSGMPTTYFAKWITGAISGYTSRETNRTSSSLAANMTKVRRAISKLEYEDKVVTPESLSIATDLSLEVVNRTLAAIKASDVKYFTDEDSGDGLEFSAAERAEHALPPEMVGPSPEHEALMRMHLDTWRKVAAERLSTDEHSVFWAFFGPYVDTGDPVPIANVAEDLSMSTRAVSEIIGRIKRILGHDSRILSLYPQYAPKSSRPTIKPPRHINALEDVDWGIRDTEEDKSDIEVVGALDAIFKTE